MTRLALCDVPTEKIVSCGAYVTRGSGTNLEVLLIKQMTHSTTWGIPKGRIREGETIEACALREVAEETGLTVVLGERRDDIVGNEKVIFVFTATAVGDNEPNVDNEYCEVAEARWFFVRGLSSTMLNSMQRHAILDTVAELGCLSAADTKIQEGFEFVFAYASHIDDWLEIKKEIVNYIAPQHRSRFSKRHEETRQQLTNDFERRLAAQWSARTGRDVIFSKEHDEATNDGGWLKRMQAKKAARVHKADPKRG
jgi:ADP-ribose pyrophosphatase YjhB (NUDIX family)